MVATLEPAAAFLAVVVFQVRVGGRRVGDGRLACRCVRGGCPSPLSAAVDDADYDEWRR